MRLFSPDYRWEWNGSTWVEASQPIFSPDGQHLWVGEEWIPIPPSGEPQPQQDSVESVQEEQSMEHYENEDINDDHSTDGEPNEHDDGLNHEPQHDEDEKKNMTEEEILDQDVINEDPDSIREIDLSGWELSIIGEDIDGNRMELYDERRDLTVTELLGHLSDHLDLIPSHFEQDKKTIFMITMYLIPPKERFLPWVIEQHGEETIESFYRCTVDEWWMKKVIDRTANDALYLPNLHFVWYSDSNDVTAEGHFGVDAINGMDLNINLKLSKIEKSDMMQLVVWLVNGKYEQIKSMIN